MSPVTHDISFSFDAPNDVLNRLLVPLQQRLNQPIAGTSRGMLVREARTVLVIDAHDRRRQYITDLLVQAGFRCLPTKDALEAFTLFLQGAYVPFAIVLGRDDDAKHFFLQRLLQQVARKYDWEAPLLRLHGMPSQRETMLQTPITPLPMTPETPIPPTTNAFTRQPPPFHERRTGPVGAPSSPSNGLPAESALKPKVSLTGQSLGRYQIGDLLGESRHSVVYQTYDRLREQDIALKAIQTDAVPYFIMEKSLEDVTIFQQEAELLGKLKHPHILPILNYGKSYISGSPFIYKTMPYCPERSLANWLQSHGGAGSFSPADVVHVSLQLADALQYIHEQRITYQNFKLSNILVSNQSTKMRDLQVALADFPGSQDGSFFSRTPDAYPYMAPERWNGVTLPESDQYALAAITYELLTGRLPFQGSAEHVMKLLHTTMQPQPPSAINPAIPLAINAVLLRALAKKPGERFASIALFIATLQRACS